jgi:aminoglycoside 6'-N-acetyltransferase
MPPVTLRALTDDDVKPLTAMLLEPAVAKHWHGYDEARVRRDLLHPEEDLTVWGIVVDGALGGAIQLGEVSDPDYRHGSIDLFVAPAHQGQGVGPRAITAVVDIAFCERDLHRLVIDPAFDNTRAIRAYARCGFRAVGRMRAYERGPDGTFHDGLLMERQRDDAAERPLPLTAGAVLRSAAPDDDDAIVAMGVQLYVEDPGQRAVGPADVRRTLHQFLVQPQRGRVVVVAREERAVAYAILCAFWSNELGGLVCIVDEIFVAPDVRGRGISTALLQALIARRVPGFEAIVAVDLEVSPGNARARALYSRLGFQAQKNAGMRRLVP